MVPVTTLLREQGVFIIETYYTSGRFRALEKYNCPKGISLREFRKLRDDPKRGTIKITTPSKGIIYLD